MIVMVINFIGFVSGLRINEVEANPEGNDAGYEWIELYSDEEVDLEGYTLENNDGGFYELSGIISAGDYFIVNFGSQWLDNSEERVFLIFLDEVIDETDVFDDGENDGNSWNLCGDQWIFFESSEREKNNCPEIDNETIGEEIAVNDSAEAKSSIDLEDEKYEYVSINKVQGVKGKIVLNPPVVEQEDKNSNWDYVSIQEKTRIGVIFSFLVLCVVLIVLLALKGL